MRKILWRKDRYQLVAMIFSLIFCGMSLFRGVDISLIADEIGTIASAPYLAGFDWSDVVSKTNYYGFGYYWIAFVLFKMMDNYVVIFAAITFFNFILCTGVSIRIYLILTREFGLPENIITTLVVSICCTFRHNAYDFANEYPVFILTWLICALLAKLCHKNNSDKTNTKCTVALALILIYALTVHERMIGLWISVCITILVFRLLFGKKIVVEKYFFLLMSMGFFIQRIFRKEVLKSLWLLSDGQKITNMTALSINSFSFLKSWNTICTMFDCMVSNFYKLVLSSYGMVFAVLCMILVKGIQTISRKCRKKIIINEYDMRAILIICVYGMTITIMMIGLATKGAESIYKGYISGIPTAGYKHFFYMRYYYPFIGPVFAAGYTLLVKYAAAIKKYIPAVFMCCFVVFFYLCWRILPRVKGTNYFAIRTNFSPIITRWWNDTTDQAQIFNVIFSFLILLICCYLTFTLDKKKSQAVWIALIVAVLCRQASFVWNDEPAKFTSQTAGASYEFIKNLEKDVQIPKKVYCLNDIYTFQFVLSRYSIVGEMPKKSEKNVIIFSRNSLDNEEKMSGFYSIQLDDNEYVYIKGDVLVKSAAINYTLRLCEGESQ